MISPEQHKRIFGWLIAVLVIYLGINKLIGNDDQEAPLSKTEDIVSSITMNVTTKVLDKQKHSHLYPVSECVESVSPESAGVENVGPSTSDKASSKDGSENTGSRYDSDMNKVTGSAEHQQSLNRDCTTPTPEHDN